MVMVVLFVVIVVVLVLLVIVIVLVLVRSGCALLSRGRNLVRCHRTSPNILTVIFHGSCSLLVRYECRPVHRSVL